MKSNFFLSSFCSLFILLYNYKNKFKKKIKVASLPINVRYMIIRYHYTQSHVSLTQRNIPNHRITSRITIYRQRKCFIETVFSGFMALRHNV